MQRAAVLTLQRLSRIWVAPIRAPRDIVERRRHQPSATLVRRRFANSHTIACTISIWTAFARRDCLINSRPSTLVRLWHSPDVASQSCDGRLEPESGTSREG